MRLGSCIALEVATGVLTLSAAAWGVAFATGAVRGDHEHVRHQASLVAPPARVGVAPDVGPAPATVPGRLPPAATGSGAGSQALSASETEPGRELEPADHDAGVDAAPQVAAAGVPAAAGPLEPVWVFLDQPDEPLLAPLRTGELARVKFNGGGSSLSMRLEFADGSKAAFKPDQTHRHSNPRKEIAAYRIDRLLAIGRVSPAIGRAFPLREIEAKLAGSARDDEHRLSEEAIPHGGELRGEMSWWIPVLGVGHVEGKYKIDSAAGVDRWKKWLHQDNDIPPDEVEMCAQLSNITLFDFLIDNLDRWSGGNANTTEDGKTIYYMDNTMAFSLDAEGGKKSQAALARVEKFSRSLVSRIRALDEASLRKVLSVDTGPYEEILTGPEIAAVLQRRDTLLKYIDELIARHGEAKVLAFP
ncbi:MAG TPA: hypothetical protein VHE35_31640 [Kofleriaceae bacterium]|nr:hypothetical protein [Kofleriaceae bacterium]